MEIVLWKVLRIVFKIPPVGSTGTEVTLSEPRLMSVYVVMEVYEERIIVVIALLVS